MIWKTLAVDKMDIEKTADLKCISRLLVEKWHVDQIKIKITVSPRNARKRQTELDARTVQVQVLSAAQIEALHYALAVFFFVCHMPFAVVEHLAFVALVTALAPAYAPHMFKRNSLSRTWLDRLYEETEEKTNSMFDRLPGKATLIIDGFKDVRK